MRYLCLTIVLSTILYFTPYCQVQKCGEIGLNIGGSYYLGDINKIPFNSTRLAAGVFYRHTFDTRYALRASFNYLNIAADDSKLGSDFQNERNAKFKQMVLEVNAAGEFNFMPFLPANPKYDYTPYLHAGIGANYLPKGAKQNIITIPFGVGVKYNFNRDYTISVEGTMYKTFTDYLEGFYQESSANNFVKQKFYEGNNDWYSFFAIKMAYKIKYKLKCPAFD